MYFPFHLHQPANCLRIRCSAYHGTLFQLRLLLLSIRRPNKRCHWPNRSSLCVTNFLSGVPNEMKLPRNQLAQHRICPASRYRPLAGLFFKNLSVDARSIKLAAALRLLDFTPVFLLFFDFSFCFTSMYFVNNVSSSESGSSYHFCNATFVRIYVADQFYITLTLAKATW